MSKYKMISPKVPNVPWQECPAELNGAPVWRYKENPIIGRNPVKGVARIFNSAVMPYGDEFIGVFRGEQTNGIPYIYLGRSKDAIHWNFEENKINFVDENGESFMPVYAYDPRLVKVEDTYYIIWCQDFYGAAIGMAKTTDFKTFTRIENPFLPFNRNAVLFPRKIGGKFAMMHRPKQFVGERYGVKYPSIWLKFSDDLLAWEDKPSHLLIAGREGTWEEKIGGSTPPILTEAGWLTLYHGVADGGTAEYRVGALLLDRENPLRVLARTPEPILEPEFFYETEGFYSHCVFPTGNVVVDGVLYVYYGGADKYVGVATCRLEELLNYLTEKCRCE